ncbi:MAG: hypothetical protein AB7S38_26825 [Vulcanimicrobiota bacterium]
MTVFYLVEEQPISLYWARDAALNWLYAHHLQVPFQLGGPEWALEQLGWLGLDWLPIESQAGQALVDEARLDTLAELFRARGIQVELKPLPRFHSESSQLSCYQAQGLVAEALLTCLVESSWSSPRGGQDLTRTELLLYFSLDGLKSAAAGIEAERLEAAHRFFLEELTPKELLARTLGSRLPWLSEREQMELEGLALLYGEEVEDLNEFRQRLDFFFEPPAAPAVPVAGAGFAGLEKWNTATLRDQLDGLDPAAREAVALATVGRDEPFLAEALALLGRDKTLARLEKGSSLAG